MPLPPIAMHLQKQKLQKTAALSQLMVDSQMGSFPPRFLVKIKIYLNAPPRDVTHRFMAKSLLKTNKLKNNKLSNPKGKRR